MSPGIARRVTEYFHPAPPSSLRETLTTREGQILHAVEEGLSNKAVAERFGISLETVKSHVKKIYLKLEVNNRLDLVRGKHR